VTVKFILIFTLILVLGSGTVTNSYKPKVKSIVEVKAKLNLKFLYSIAVRLFWLVIIIIITKFEKIKFNLSYRDMLIDIRIISSNCT